MKKKNKLSRSIFVTLCGALFGAFIGFIVPLLSDTSEYLVNAIPFNLMYIIILILFIIAIILLLKSISQYKSMHNVSGKSEDDQFIYIQKQYNLASKNVANSGHYSVLGITLSVATFLFDFDLKSLIILSATMITFFVLVFFTTKHNKRVLLDYTKIINNDYQIDYEDRNIMHNLINNIDEGERLIMLHALSKTYMFLIYALSGLLMILAIYQINSGENQYVAMFGIGVILIYSTIVYYKKSEEFNK